MIEFFRRASESIVARIFFAFLAISFAFMWGGQEGLRMIGIGRDSTVATVGSETITNRDLALAIERFRMLAQSQGGGEITMKEIRDSGLDRQMLDTLIAESLIRQEAKRLDITVSDSYVIDQLRDQQMFKRADGTFSKETFTRFISNLGFASEKEYVNYTKSEILRSRVMAALSANASLPLISHAPLFAWNEQVRTADAMVIDSDLIQVDSVIPDDELRDYYGKNRGQFIVPERRTFKALIIPTKAMDITVKESDIELVYDLEKDRKFKDVKSDEARMQIRKQLRQEAIQSAMIEKSTALQTAFDEGQSLADIAKKEGYEIRTFTAVEAVDASQPRTAADQDIIEFAFTALESELSPLEAIQNGELYASVLVEAILEPDQLSFDDARDKLIAAVVKQKKVEKTKDIIAAMENELKEGVPFKNVGAKYGFKISKIRANRGRMLTPTPSDMLTAQAGRLFMIPNQGLTIMPYATEKKGVQYALVKITSVKNGDPQKDPEGFQRFKNRMQSQIAMDMYQLFVADLRSRQSVEINQRYFATEKQS